MIQPIVRPLLIVAVAANLFATGVSFSSAETKGDRIRHQLLKLHNQERKAAGVEPLTVNAELTKAAQEYAEVLAKSEEFGHTVKGTPRTRVKDAGYKPTAVGENIAIGQESPAEVVKGWMESKTHKENILRQEYSEAGFGFATNDEGEIVWVVDFGSP